MLPDYRLQYFLLKAAMWEEFDGTTEQVFETYNKMVNYLDQFGPSIRMQVSYLITQDLLEIIIHEGEVVLLVNANDTFYYASADSTRVSIENLPKYFKLCKKYPEYGYLIWQCLHRNEMPLKPLQTPEFLEQYNKEKAKWSK